MSGERPTPAEEANLAASAGARAFRRRVGLPHAPGRRLGLRHSPRARLDELGSDGRGYRMRRLLALADIVAITAAIGVSVVIDALVARNDGFGAPLEFGRPIAFIIAAILLWIVIAGLAGSYHVDERRIENSVADDVGGLLPLTAAWAWIAFLIDSIASEGVLSIAPMLLLWVLMVPMILFTRAGVRHMAQKRPWYRQPAFLVGRPGDTDRVRAVFERHPEFGIDIVREVELDDGSGLMPVRRLIDDARETAVARVIFASSHEGLDERTGALRFLAEEDIKVDLVPGDSEVFRSDAELHFIEGLPLLTLPTRRRPRATVLGKRILDVGLASFGLLITAPVLAYCAIGIKRDSPGPVFFRQRRAGRKGERFELLKFRTMVADADAMKDDLRHLNARTDGMFKLDNDPRITKFGARLRRTSLDELPQLINVLRGEMSLVGPRPLIEDEATLVEDHYMMRFEMKPGITGPWQVMGRSDIPFEKMLKLDYAYVVNWSFGEDMKLLVRTASAITHRRGAY